MNINPGDALLSKLAAEATKKIRGFIAQNLSNTIWCACLRPVMPLTCSNYEATVVSGLDPRFVC